MTFTTDAIVIGAGVVGLACARALALSGRETVILEREAAIGTGISSRNSEVIHAGLYYPTGSLKHRLCVEGRRALYAFCAEHGVPYRRTGKLIVAPAGEEAALTRLLGQARRNGVEGVEPIGPAEAAAMEPQVVCAAALHSAETGIVEAHGFMLALLGDAEAAGAMLALNTGVVAVRTDGGLAVETLDRSSGERSEIEARLVVNAAGLGAQGVAATVAGLDPRHVPPLHLAKGNYFALAGRPPFRRPVYPLPVPGGLGTHATVDLAGRVRFGPDVEWVAREDYPVDPGRRRLFFDSIRRWWPGIDPERLQPDYSGIRPKLGPPGAPASDFLVQGEATHAIPGLVNLFGIESPGLTAALALARLVSGNPDV
jgi:L-2-hydroxyglutarate oxidase LhgO